MFKFVTFFTFIIPSLAHAYLGPGVGGGVIVAAIGVVVAIFAGIFGLLWFPIKRFLKKRRNAKQEKKQN